MFAFLELSEIAVGQEKEDSRKTAEDEDTRMNNWSGSLLLQCPETLSSDSTSRVPGFQPSKKIRR